MEIHAIIPSTLIDFPGKIAATIYVQGCNRRCCYCHNPELQPFLPGNFKWRSIKKALSERYGFLDGVVFSGGEPTFQDDLVKKMQECKALGFKVAMHTNGDGPMLEAAAEMCEYVLLSHETPEKLYLTSRATRVEVFDPGNIDWGNSAIIRKMEERRHIG